MKLSRRNLLRLASGALVLPALPRIARAQNFPNRVVRLLVGFPAGGGADAAARIIAGRLSEIWGQQVVVENRAGAGGNIALDATAHAVPDGYTIVLAVNAPSIYGFLFGTLNYDPVADLAPLSLIGTYPHIMVTSNAGPFKSLGDFIAAARAEPGKLTFASPGVGTPSHLTGELFKHMAGINITHVPYRGVAAGTMSDLLTGRIDANFNTTGSLLQPVRSGQVRGLGVSTAQRFAGAPDVPTIAEGGVPGFNVTSWYGLFAPARTPAPILQQLNADLVAMLAEPAVKARFEPLGITVGGSTPDALAAKARADAELWGPIIKAANIRGE
jgi:tripartite-type tricarboxylate transporter receptor subunit TctC